MSVVNPAMAPRRATFIHAYAKVHLRRNKTDVLDADLKVALGGAIARYCLTEQPQPWTPPAQETLDLQAILKHLDDGPAPRTGRGASEGHFLKTMRQQECNRLESMAPPRATFVPCPQAAKFIQQHIDFLDAQIVELDAAAKTLTKATPTFAAQFKLLLTIPGKVALLATV